jgi:hypothetical protein
LGKEEDKDEEEEEDQPEILMPQTTGGKVSKKLLPKATLVVGDKHALSRYGPA